MVYNDLHFKLIFGFHLRGCKEERRKEKKKNNLFFLPFVIHVLPDYIGI